MDGSNFIFIFIFIFIVTAIVIQICLCTGAARALTDGSHPPGLPRDADQPRRTKHRPNHDQASSDPRGSEIPAAGAA